MQKMQGVHERITAARQRRGYKTAADAIEAFGWIRSTYVQHENGTRIPKDSTLERYARAYGVSMAWLQLGIGEPTAKVMGAPRVRFAGLIGAGQIVNPIDDMAEEIEAIIGVEGGEAFEVAGDSMMPLAKPGDIVFFGPPRPARALIGQECIVELVDGRRMFKTIERGSRDGLYSLISYNAEALRDCEVARAGVFIGLRRGIRR